MISSLISVGVGVGTLNTKAGLGLGTTAYMQPNANHRTEISTAAISSTGKCPSAFASTSTSISAFGITHPDVTMNRFGDGHGDEYKANGGNGGNEGDWISNLLAEWKSERRGQSVVVRFPSSVCASLSSTA